VPTIELGHPAPAEAGKFLTAEVNGITVYYPEGLHPKHGQTAVRIRRRKFLFWSWLEVEGARPMPVYV